jgi:hypothetical protein
MRNAISGMAWRQYQHQERSGIMAAKISKQKSEIIMASITIIINVIIITICMYMYVMYIYQ